ncbi:MAG: hypothetical protein AB4372_27235 [Xenococcus sp. (in: cyanobacteria)]|nr:hypothetical protein [Xenococcaceae cyanobacterium MO_167.B52]
MYEVVFDNQDEDLALELSYSISEGEIGFPELAPQYIEELELGRCGDIED